MSRNKKTTAKIETPVVNIETVATEAPAVLEVSAEELAEAIKAEQNEDANAAPAEDTVKLVIVRSLSTGSKKGGESNIVPIPQSVIDAVAEAGLNTVNSIKSLYATGYSRAQIVAAGYNSSTVYRQVGEYIKSLATVKAEKAEIKENAAMLIEATGTGDLTDPNEGEEETEDEETEA